MYIKTSDQAKVNEYLAKIQVPQPNSHKGQNGKLLIIGGSSLFHSAAIWAAETASHFVDMVHFASTDENNEIMKTYKQKFRNGIVVPRTELVTYIKEDDAVLIGNGMMRSEDAQDTSNTSKVTDILQLADEGLLTKELVHILLINFPEKRVVIDAGGLQMMDPQWLEDRKTPVILTPHQKEFTALFGIDIANLSTEEKIRLVEEYAKKFNCVIVLKAVCDIISDGAQTVVIEGGNAGLTKGGSGDVLAALSASFYTKNEPFLSAVCASLLLKATADSLFINHGYWYNTTTLIEEIPQELTRRRNTI